MGQNIGDGGNQTPIPPSKNSGKRVLRIPKGISPRQKGKGKTRVVTPPKSKEKGKKQGLGHIKEGLL